MYSGSGFSDWEIGDITVIKHKDTYHLFHLIIPNHDYIAHAVSTDGLSWKRVKNAIFVGDPGEWDDDMLWTMHVCEVNGKFEMYYTGLQRKDRGIVSRIGLAVSDDLYSWEKVENNIYPFEPKGSYYETLEVNDRQWLSFRDPFRYDYNDEVYFLICMRVNKGPVSRRGCVGLMKVNENNVEALPPLIHPMVYDDVECPCVFYLKGNYYLIGSIREDIKVRYWFAPEFRGEYHSFHADVLLPQGNYAARIIEEEDGRILLYNFYYAGQINQYRTMPPPKELDVDERGRLILKSYHVWDKIVRKTIPQKDFGEVKQLMKNDTSTFENENNIWTCGAKSGYEIYSFEKPAKDFIWEGVIEVTGMGKLGIVSDMDDDANGYFISFDIQNGIVQLRAWGLNEKDNRSNFVFNNLQTNNFPIPKEKKFFFRLIRYGSYIELMIGKEIKITLIDYTYSGNRIGLYSSSSLIVLKDSVISTLPSPKSEYGSQEENDMMVL